MAGIENILTNGYDDQQSNHISTKYFLKFSLLNLKYLIYYEYVYLNLYVINTKNNEFVYWFTT